MKQVSKSNGEEHCNALISKGIDERFLGKIFEGGGDREIRIGEGLANHILF